MGEAKRKKADQQAWLNGLTPDEQKIVQVCRHLHARLNKRAGFVEACYFYAFFLRKYLREEHGIVVNPVVGWARFKSNLFAHAWVEYKDKVIDLSLIQTNNPVVAPPGQLLVLGFPLAEGVAYKYMKETSPEIAAAAGVDRIAMVEKMRAIAQDDQRIDDYFRNAPPQYRYEAVAASLT